MLFRGPEDLGRPRTINSIGGVVVSLPDLDLGHQEARPLNLPRN